MYSSHHGGKSGGYDYSNSDHNRMTFNQVKKKKKSSFGANVAFMFKKQS